MVETAANAHVFQKKAPAGTRRFSAEIPPRLASEKKVLWVAVCHPQELRP